MGKIVAIGGGENGRPGTEYETGAIDREIIAMTGKARPRFLFIGLANVYADGYYNVMRNVYHGMYGCETEHLTAEDIKDPQIASSKNSNRRHDLRRRREHPASDEAAKKTPG